MVTTKRSLLLIIGLLCALSITACGGVAKATNDVASPGNAAVTAPAVPTAQPTTNPIKVQVQNQNSTPQSNQASVQVKNQTPNTSTHPAAPSNPTATQNNQKAQDTNPNPAQDMPQVAAANTNNTNNTNTNNTNTNNGTSVTVVASAMLNVNGQMANVLTTGNGLTLYYRTTDAGPNAVCTGACAQTWPPFMAQGNVVTGTPIKGSFTVQATANGSQVAYNGHPLYTYSGDNTSGQINGQGVNGVWNAVTVLAQAQHW